ncbi:hypothetical protein GQ54DRAFT_10538 [Martensiomyces pterosporus]|nr:hypothetical protein GQ54DRAFT_10538 [Martensiomyces pterosporus]
MGFEILHQVDAPESSAQPAKRRRTTRRTACAADTSLPSGFPQPPAGFEDRFDGWARRWMEMHPHGAASGELSMALARLMQLVTSTADYQGPGIPEAAQKRCQAAQAWLDKLTAATSKLIDVKVKALEETVSGESRNLKLVNEELKCFQEYIEKAQAELKDAWAEAGITAAAGMVDEMLCLKTHVLVEGKNLCTYSCFWLYACELLWYT